jgi:hypothetical protein
VHGVRGGNGAMTKKASRAASRRPMAATGTRVPSSWTASTAAMALSPGSTSLTRPHHRPHGCWPNDCSTTPPSSWGMRATPPPS